MDLRTKQELAEAERDLTAFTMAYDELVSTRERLKIATHRIVPLPELEDAIIRTQDTCTGLQSRITRIRAVGR